MKLTSWNVNGLRSIAGKGLFEWLAAEQPDLVCLQETKAHPDQLEPHIAAPPGYRGAFHAASRKGYSGVATFWKEPRADAAPIEAPSSGLGIARFDREGRVLTTRHRDFDLVNVYVPNSQRDLARLEFKLDFCDSFLAYCNRLRRSGRPLILCGDFNTAHTELDLARPKANQGNSGFHPQERAWMDEFLSKGYVDVFRKLHPDDRQYTWWSYLFKARQANIGWRIDYFFVTPDIEGRVDRADILAEVTGSDHCPVRLELSEK